VIDSPSPRRWNRPQCISADSEIRKENVHVDQFEVRPVQDDVDVGCRPIRLGGSRAVKVVETTSERSLAVSTAA